MTPEIRYIMQWAIVILVMIGLVANITTIILLLIFLPRAISFVRVSKDYLRITKHYAKLTAMAAQETERGTTKTAEMVEQVKKAIVNHPSSESPVVVPQESREGYNG